MGGRNKLSAKAVEKTSEPGRYGDGGNLFLQVSQWRTKSWLFRYMRDGRAREMGLGPYPDVSLERARKKAAEARTQLHDGIDPLQAKQARKAAARVERAKNVSFLKCAEDYIAEHEAGWKNAKHTAQWKSTLTGDGAVTAEINKLPVATIDTALVLKCLKPIWQDKPETATRVRARIERVLAWATVQHLRTGDNPARWAGHLKELLPSKSKLRRVRHHPAMPYADLPLFMAQLRERDSISARALEFTILCAARTNETIGAAWDEFDLSAKVWTIPAERMKAGRQHRVPLSDRAIEILEKLPREDSNAFAFIGGKEAGGLSNMAMLELLRGMDGNGFTVHGFRSTFRDWAAETTGYPNHVVEMALAHMVGDKVEAAYRRGELFEKRRRLMRDWTNYCARPFAGASITTIRQAASA